MGGRHADARWPGGNAVTSTFERLYFGEGPAFSAELDAWLHPDGARLRFTDDPEGTHPWLTPLERALAENQHERSEKERERILREAAEQRIPELEEKLGGR